MAAHWYRIHGLDLVADIAVETWPALPCDNASESRAPWRVTIESNSSSVVNEVPPRTGPARWEWRDTSALTTMDISGTPPGWDPSVAAAAQFTVDFALRSIRVRHSHADEAGCIDLLTRWLLPDLARAERDLLPLHACAVETPIGALLVLGDSGRGKSTLTAALLACGTTFLGDEPICIGMQGAWPGPTALRIDPKTAEELLDTSGPIDATGKAFIPFEIDASAARPLAGLVRLAPRRATGELLRWESPRTADSLQALMELRYSRIQRVENVRGDLRRAATLLSDIPMISVSLLDDEGCVVEAAAELVDVVASLGKAPRRIPGV